MIIRANYNDNNLQKTVKTVHYNNDDIDDNNNNNNVRFTLR